MVFSKKTQQKKAFIEKLLVVLDNHLIENSSSNIFDPFLVFSSYKDISQIKLEINEEIITNLFKNISSESALIRLVFLYRTDNLTPKQKVKLSLTIESLQYNRSLSLSNSLFQSTFEFIIDSTYTKERSPFQTIQNFVTNKKIPNISNDGVYHEGTAFDNYFSEFSFLIDETIKIHKEIPREIFVEWLNKFFLWWETEKKSFFKEDTEKIWLFRLPDYLLKLTYYFNNTILRNIPLSSLDHSLKENLSLLVKDIYHNKLHCFVYFFPQAKRLNLNLDYTKDYTDLIWRFTDDNIKHAIGSLYHYLGLIAESEIKEDPAPLINHLFAILKYGSHHNKLFACDTIHRTIKMYPKLFQKENCDFLIEFSINYYDMIIENSELIMSQDDFELQASISTLVTQLRINKTEHVGNKLDLWKEFIENNILPEIRMNSDSFTL